MPTRTIDEHLEKLDAILAKLEDEGLSHAAALVAEAIDTLRSGVPLSGDEIDELEAGLWATRVSH